MLKRSFVAVVVTSLVGASACADSVQFRLGESAPSLAIEPAFPTNTDVISFTTPLDGVTYDNDCFAAAALGGSIILERDDPSFTVQLGYEGDTPVVCPLHIRPVTGAKGDLGPLAAGQWTLQDAHGNSLSFLVGPEVPDGDLAIYRTIRDNLGNEVGSPQEGDLNRDGVVDLFDFDVWKKAHSGVGTSQAAVPEPAAVALLMTSLSVILLQPCPKYARFWTRLSAAARMPPLGGSHALRGAPRRPS